MSIEAHEATGRSRMHIRTNKTHNNPAPTWCADQAFKESVIALKLSAGVSALQRLRSNHAPCQTHTDTGRHRSDWTSHVYSPFQCQTDVSFNNKDYRHIVCRCIKRGILNQIIQIIKIIEMELHKQHHGFHSNNHNDLGE